MLYYVNRQVPSHNFVLFSVFFLIVSFLCVLTRKNHISKSIVPRVLKLGREIGLVDLLIDLKGQGLRSKVKVTR